MFYFVVYEIKAKTPGIPNIMPGLHNTVIAGKHPLVWAAEVPDNNRRLGWVTYIHFFAEVPEEVFNQVDALHHMSVEDYRQEVK